MGYASYLILKDGIGDKRNLALGLYGTQLALNWVCCFNNFAANIKIMNV
jgi:hypothetical protein